MLLRLQMTMSSCCVRGDEHMEVQVLGVPVSAAMTSASSAAQCKTAIWQDFVSRSGRACNEVRGAARWSASGLCAATVGSCCCAARWSVSSSVEAHVGSMTKRGRPGTDRELRVTCPAVAAPKRRRSLPSAWAMLKNSDYRGVLISDSRTPMVKNSNYRGFFL
jgi:hypothetical protein